MDSEYGEYDEYDEYSGNSDYEHIFIAPSTREAFNEFSKSCQKELTDFKQKLKNISIEFSKKYASTLSEENIGDIVYWASCNEIDHDYNFARDLAEIALETAHKTGTKQEKLKEVNAWKNTQINHNEEILEKLHQLHGWIPGRNHIRPSQETLDRKRLILNSELKDYNSPLEHILSTVFNLTLPIQVPTKPICCFLPNKFPYEMPEGTNHWILWIWPWNTENKEKEEISQLITMYIEEELRKVVDKDSFRFVYYINPKMTFPEVFHVQVFWTLWPRLSI